MIKTSVIQSVLIASILGVLVTYNLSAQEGLKQTETDSEQTVLFVERSEKGVLLEWNSPEEVKPGYFNVERSTPEGGFELISVVFAAGNTVSMTGYALKLTADEPAEADYRVVFVEHDGPIAVSRKEFKTMPKKLHKKNLANQQ